MFLAGSAAEPRRGSEGFFLFSTAAATTSSCASPSWESSSMQGDHTVADELFGILRRFHEITSAFLNYGKMSFYMI